MESSSGAPAAKRPATAKQDKGTHGSGTRGVEVQDAAMQARQGSVEGQETQFALLRLGSASVETFLRVASAALPARGTYYVVDLRRSLPETVWACGADCEAWFGIPGAAIETIEAIGAGFGGDPARPLCCVTFKAEFAALSTTLNSLSGMGGARGNFLARPDDPLLDSACAPPAEARPEAVRVQQTTWTLDHVTRGNCEMEAGARFLLRSDGTGAFLARVKTNYAREGDCWYQAFRVKNRHGALLFTLPAGIGYYVSARLDDDHGWYDWRIDFAYNQANYPFAYWLEYGDSSSQGAEQALEKREEIRGASSAPNT